MMEECKDPSIELLWVGGELKWSTSTDGADSYRGTGVGGGGGDAVALRTKCPRGPCPRCTKACRVASI
jgi:hypothetical protein